MEKLELGLRNLHVCLHHGIMAETEVINLTAIAGGIYRLAGDAVHINKLNPEHCMMQHGRPMEDFIHFLHS